MAYVRALQRRWKIIVACVLIALPIGLLLGPDVTSTGADPDELMFEATTYLRPSEESVIRGASNLDGVAAIADLGVVQERVAEELDFRGTATDLTDQIEVAANEGAQWLVVTAAAPFAPRAEAIADTFATELVAYLGELNQEEIGEVEDQLLVVDRELRRVRNQEETEGTRGGVTDEESTLLNDHDVLISRLTDLQSSSSSLRILVPAQAVPVAASTGTQVPAGQSFRLLIAALVGFVVGVAIALFRERLDPRVQDREQAESAFGVPVLADIPTTPRRFRRSVIVTSDPGAATSNGYQFLAAGLSFGRHRPASRPGTVTDRAVSQTILVTSPVGSEAKATTVANLAAAFAGVGKQVIVISCVLDVPSAHAMLGVEQGPGLADLLDETQELGYEQVLHDTTVQGVRFVPAGWKHDATKGHALFSSSGMERLLKEAAATFDVVLVEAAPVLANSDWAQLIPNVDAVLVVARAGSTTWGSAERTADLLEMLQAPVVGVALTGTSVSATRRAGSRGHGVDRVASGDAVAPGPVAPVQRTTIVPDLAATDANGNGETSTRDGGFSHATQPPADSS